MSHTKKRVNAKKILHQKAIKRVYPTITSYTKLNNCILHCLLYFRQLKSRTPPLVEEAVDECEETHKLTKELKFGDEGFYDVDPNDVEIDDTTWGEVCHMCCCHTGMEWFYIFIGVTILLLFLYFFLVGLELLSASARVLTGCVANSLFGADTNPISSFCVGMLATVLFQSSSATSSIIVTLTGANAISVQAGIYMGTS